MYFIDLSHDRWPTIMIIITLMFFITSCGGAQYDTYLTHFEDPSNDLFYFDSYTKVDGTILLQFVRFSNPEQNCIEPDIHLRIVFSDGTIKPLKLAHQIPLYNFCMIQNAFFNFLINEYAILVTYLNGEDVTTTMHTGMIVDFDGNIIQIVEFGIGVGKINPSKDDEYGFTWSRQVNETTIVWSRFAPMPTNPKYFFKSGSGFITSPNASIIKSFKVFNSGDGGVYFVLVNKLNQITTIDPAWNVHAILIDKSSLVISSPYLLYQSQMDFFDLNFIGCHNSNGEGYNCLMRVKTIDPEKMGNGDSVYFLLTFLTSGSVINIKKLDIGKNPKRNIVDVMILLNHGFLFRCFSIKDNKLMGFLLTQNGEYDGEWKGLNNDVISMSYLLHNDTMWGMRFQHSGASWAIITDKVHNKNIVDNYKHENPNILGTTPNDDIIRLKEFTTITIDYDKPLILSSGNISIYQVVDNMGELLRQTYSGLSGHASITNNTSVNIEVLSSTFNDPSASYFVSISDDFVNSKQFNEAIPGIRKRVWFLNTSIEEPDLCLSPVTLLLRLNANGTIYFKTLNSVEINKFYNDLMDELSNIIPVERSRLPEFGKFQNDPFDSNNLILMQVKISQPTETLKPCAEEIANDMDALIKNKHFTLISHYPLSSMLDEIYGANKTAEGWSDEFKLNLLLALGGVMFVVVIYFIARYKNSQGRNVFVFTFALIATDFILDIAFIVYNSQMVSSLFMPSILFLVIPTVFNLIFTLYILLKEHFTNEQFRVWLVSNTKVVPILTILASADIAMLNIINSNLAGLSCFQVPISKDAEIQIFWGRFANIFIEDIPQFVIRVIYLKRNSIVYDPIPIFSLISVGLSILFSLIGRGFDTLIYKILYTSTSQEPTVDDKGHINDSNNGNTS
ncbi:12384_t:CDS:2 [Funneliformis geosporum]|uniref:9791_t:CDS:1 n=1 Tax=Funneliformis geosporum TaxID=1117311 RepID=A0A9W4SJ14_9GLOM|nr:12384_t:CDS:2 [Funneliformis geosporum]CAI2171266.1 9791_t:CDS:2 [Funneliformis geosporum]